MSKPSKEFQFYQRGRIGVLRHERDQLRQRLDVVEEELRTLEMADALDTYTCECVNLNSKMGIYDCVEQERRNRVPVHDGIVSSSLSASRSCSECGGTGKPRR